MYEYFKILLDFYEKKTSDVCKATGISQSTISNWKKRQNQLSTDLLKKIAEYFDVPLLFLISGYATRMEDDNIVEYSPEEFERWSLNSIIGEQAQKEYDDEFERISKLSAQQIAEEKNVPYPYSSWVSNQVLDYVITGFDVRTTENLHKLAEDERTSSVMSTIINALADEFFK